MKKIILTGLLLCFGTVAASYAKDDALPADSQRQATAKSTRQDRRMAQESVSAAKAVIALASLKDSAFVLELDPDPGHAVKKSYNFMKVEHGRAFLQFTFTYRGMRSYSTLSGAITRMEVTPDKKGNLNVHLQVHGETDPWIHGVTGPVNLRFTLYKDTNTVLFSGWRSMSSRGLLLPVSAAANYLILQGAGPY